MSTSMQTRTLKVPGTTLYLEIRGTGRVLLCITGGPTDAGMFTDVAARLADLYTVVAYDQRGHSRSPLDGEPEDLPAPAHAEDAAAILRDVADEPAFVYGVSGGGIIGLDLVTRYPELVRVFVCQEPPLLELLPDAEQCLARFDAIHETYLSQGPFPAMGAFGAAVEQGGPAYSEEMQKMPATPESEEMGQRMVGNFDLFLEHELRQIVRYMPDFERLRQIPTRVVPAAGENSGQQAARRATIALAERMGVPVTFLPGAHGGWGADPQVYADRLHEVLQGA
jgi:pimeloyl-ACP methyl ester carboxylesterase